MSSSPSIIHVHGDALDYLLHAQGETQEQWSAPFDAAPILPELSKALYECGLNHHQLDVVKEEIADARLHILIGIFTILFRNGHHPQRVTRNVYKLAKLYCPKSVENLSHSDLALLTSDTISASSMRAHACNDFLDSLTPDQVQALIGKYGKTALRKLAQVSWTSRKAQKKSRKKKKQDAPKPRTRKHPELNLDL